MNHGWPLVTPLPGIRREQLRESLRQIHTEAYNIRAGAYGSGHGQLTRYLAWASTAVRTLGNQVSAADIDKLILTRGYERLVGSVGPTAGTDSLAVLNDLLNLELGQRLDDIDNAIKGLDEAIKRWFSSAVFVVADTSIYIEHNDKLENLDFGSVLSLIWQDKTIRVLVPIIVVDELDALKRHNDRIVRWRAGYTLAVLDRIFSTMAGPAVLREPAPDGSRGGAVMDLVFDPPGHVRLPINDDEIIDRALAMQALAETQITLLTFDTGQAFRARSVGLSVKKLNKPVGEEPSGQRGRTAGTVSRSQKVGPDKSSGQTHTG